MQLRMKPGVWYTNQQIYQMVSTSIQLTEDDYEPAASATTNPRWQRNVRNILQYRKTTDEVHWSGNGRYMIPVSSDPVAQTSSVVVHKRLSQSQFDLLQEIRAETGRAGEAFVLRSERDRLANEGRPDLAAKAHIVSQEDVGAGYDIDSFLADGTPISIEVKTTRSVYPIFEISNNEVETAKELGESYWLYLLVDFGKQNRLIKIRNPAEQFGRDIVLRPVAFTGQYTGE